MEGLNPDQQQQVAQTGREMVKVWARKAKLSIAECRRLNQEVKALRAGGAEEDMSLWNVEARAAIWGLRAAQLAEGMVAAAHVCASLEADDEAAMDPTERSKAAEVMEQDAACEMMLAILGQTRGLPDQLLSMAPALRTLPIMLASGAAALMEGDMATLKDLASGLSVADQAEAWLKGEEGKGYL